MKTSARIAMTVLSTVALFSMGAEVDPDEEFGMIFNWQKPKVYPPPMLQGMKIDTLNAMLEAGNLQWYEPRPIEDTWDAVVGLKIHAPADVIWKIATDYELQCKLMPDTFVACKTQARAGNMVTNNFKIRTSVIMFSYDFDLVDVVEEKPPYDIHIKSVEGGLKCREIDIHMAPVDGGANTLIFMRYYGAMASLGTTMQVALAALPMAEPPTTAGAANYHLRSYRNEAHKRVGYKAPEKPKDLVIENLDLPTLRLLNKGNGGLIRENPAGKLIDVLTFTFINAPPKRVWEVATDFEHYGDIVPGSEAQVESTDGNTIMMRMNVAQVSVMVFDIGGYELHARYNLKPPGEITWVSVDGTYQDSHGSLRLLPIENGAKTLLFGAIGINLDRDTGLVASIVKSGAFPVENMFDLILSQGTLAHMKKEAEKREAEKK